MNTAAAAVVASSSLPNALAGYLGTARTLFLRVYLAFTRTFWTPLSGPAPHHDTVVRAVLFLHWMAFLAAPTCLPLAATR